MLQVPVDTADVILAFNFTIFMLIFVVLFFHSDSGMNRSRIFTVSR